MFLLYQLFICFQNHVYKVFQALTWEPAPQNTRSRGGGGLLGPRMWGPMLQGEDLCFKEQLKKL